MGNGWQRAKRITGAAFRPVRGRDLSLHAAAITFYGAIAVVPVALLAIWLTALVAGADRVRRLTSHAVEALPTAIGAPRPPGRSSSRCSELHWPGPATAPTTSSPRRWPTRRGTATRW